MIKFLIYIIYFTSHIHQLLDKLWTSFLTDFIYLYRTMVHSNIKIFILFLPIFICSRKENKNKTFSCISFKMTFYLQMMPLTQMNNHLMCPKYFPNALGVPFLSMFNLPFSKAAGNTSTFIFSYVVPSYLHIHITHS
jgi:hypothetical protein